jgi:hypothetical protein
VLIFQQPTTKVLLIAGFREKYFVSFSGKHPDVSLEKPIDPTPMIRHHHLIIPLLLCGSASAQEVISASGTEFIQPSGSITYTLGEPVVETVSNSNSTLTQGFNQPWIDINTDVNGPVPVNISIYPNPTRHYLHLDIADSPSGHRYEFFDAKGALVLSGRVEDRLTTLDIQHLSSGGYVFRLYSPQATIPYSYKINITR